MNQPRNRRGSTPSTASRLRRLIGAALAMAVALLTVVVSVGGAGVAASAATAQPTCQLGLLPSITFANPGQKVSMTCQHLTASHPYLQVELSLLVAVDPTARPLLTGQLASPTGVLGAVAAVPEINAASGQIDLSDANGNLSSTYTIPTSQPPDPNAKCPPSTEQFNSGIIGCAVAMLDLTTGKPVTAGTFVFEATARAVNGIFPDAPTLAVSTTTPTKGQTVKIKDAAGAKTFWWVATLASLGALLHGGAPPTSFPVTVKSGGKVVSHAFVTPAKYQNEVFTPPKLQGTFVANHVGRQKLKVSLTASLLGFALSNSASLTIHVHK